MLAQTDQLYQVVVRQHLQQKQGGEVGAWYLSRITPMFFISCYASLKNRQSYLISFYLKKPEVKKKKKERKKGNKLVS